MFPDADDLPSSLTKPLISVSVSRSIGFDFAPPIFCIVFGPGCVDRAAVPEASIDENRDTRTGKNNICNPTRLGDQSDVKAIA